eukprot:2661141-Prorocentrum_lima.AAC.1
MVGEKKGLLRLLRALSATSATARAASDSVSAKVCIVCHDTECGSSTPRPGDQYRQWYGPP